MQTSPVPPLAQMLSLDQFPSVRNRPPYWPSVITSFDEHWNSPASNQAISYRPACASARASAFGLALSSSTTRQQIEISCAHANGDDSRTIEAFSAPPRSMA